MDRQWEQLGHLTLEEIINTEPFDLMEELERM